MATALKLEVFSPRPAKMQRLEASAHRNIREKIPYAVHQVVASFLIFKEAMYFLGRKAFWEKTGEKDVRTEPFYNWQKSKSGISTDDWTHLREQVFPKMCVRIAKASQLVWLQNLSISGFEGERLQKLTSSTFPHLQQLILKLPSDSSSTQLNQEIIAQLVKNSPQLSRVTVDYLEEVQTNALLDNCPNLVSLKIRHLRETGGSSILNWAIIAEKLSKKVSFQNLFLSNKCMLLRSQLKDIATIPQLRSITVNWLNIEDADLVLFKNHPGLETVKLSNLWNITPNTLTVLAELPSLTSLEIANCAQITSSWIDLLKLAKKLSSLALHNFAAVDIALCGLSQFPSLTRVRLIDCTGITINSFQPIGFSDQGLKWLGQCPKLREVEIVEGSLQITDAGIQALATNQLQRLKLVSTKPQYTSWGNKTTAWQNLTPQAFSELVVRSRRLQYLELPNFPHWSQKDKEQLQANIHKMRSDAFKLTFG